MGYSGERKRELDRRFVQGLFRVISMDKFAPRTLYHYTSPVGVQGILTTGCLWATNFSFLNDPLEVRYGHDLVFRVLDEQQVTDRDISEAIKRSLDTQALSEVYVCCFTRCRDDLSQWRAYGTPGVARYCIGFDYEAIEQALTKELHEVIYEERDQREAIQRVLSAAMGVLRESPSEAEYIAELAADELARLIPLLKSPAYHAEKEWRIIRWVPAADVSEVCFDIARGVVRPYIKLQFRAEEPPPVVELLVLAPGREIASIKAADMLLRQVGIGDVQSERSGVPFAE